MSRNTASHYHQPISMGDAVAKERRLHFSSSRNLINIASRDVCSGSGPVVSVKNECRQSG